MPHSDPQTQAEERANSATHGFGALLAVAGTALLLRSAVQQESARMIWSGATYGASLIGLFLASTAYHLIPLGRLPRFKNTLQAVDHAAIFLLIAGTYTPFALVAMRGSAGWTMFGVIWALAVIGIGLRLWAGTRFRRVLFVLPRRSRDEDLATLASFAELKEKLA